MTTKFNSLLHNKNTFFCGKILSLKLVKREKNTVPRYTILCDLNKDTIKFTASLRNLVILSVNELFWLNVSTNYLGFGKSYCKIFIKRNPFSSSTRSSF